MYGTSLIIINDKFCANVCKQLYFVVGKLIYFVHRQIRRQGLKIISKTGKFTLSENFNLFFFF